MIISVKWNNKNSTFKIGDYTFKVMIKSDYIFLILWQIHQVYSDSAS